MGRQHTEVQALLAMALPSFRHQVQARLLTEFGWQNVPNIDSPIESHIESYIEFQKIFEPASGTLSPISSYDKDEKTLMITRASPALNGSQPNQSVVPGRQALAGGQVPIPLPTDAHRSGNQYEGHIQPIPPPGNNLVDTQRYSLQQLSDIAIVRYLATVRSQDKRFPEVLFYPQISANEIARARSFLNVPAEETILALIDTTTFSGSSSGVAICRERFFWRERGSEPYFTHWRSVSNFRIIQGRLYLDRVGISTAEPYFNVIEVCIAAMVKLATSGWQAPPHPPK